LGKPELELEKEVQTLRNWLEKQTPDLEVPVRGVVVFTHPNAELQLDDPPVTVLRPKQLKGWLRRAGKLPPLPKETFHRLTQLLDTAVQVGDSEEDE
jgi:hypothetical protein